MSSYYLRPKAARTDLTPASRELIERGSRAVSAERAAELKAEWTLVAAYVKYSMRIDKSYSKREIDFMLERDR